MLDRRTILNIAAATVMSTMAIALGLTVASAQDLANACPVDDCRVKIVKAELINGEVAVMFEANFKPEMSKNHLHVWWGDLFTIKQVSGNAETVHKVKQGEWHPTDAYPSYKTHGPISTKVRKGSNKLCVTTSDRNHNILDANIFHCVDVSKLF